MMPTTYTVSMPNAKAHQLHVELSLDVVSQSSISLHMSAWTPGFYSVMRYAGNVKNFHAESGGDTLRWSKTSNLIWRIIPQKSGIVKISYDIKVEDQFIANTYVDEKYGYLLPSALFMYLSDQVNKPVDIVVIPFKGWPNIIATGLKPVRGKHNEFTASNFDELYDSPILVGELEAFPRKALNGTSLNFVTYNSAKFNRNLFMGDIKKIATASFGIIGDIPFKSYSFLGIGVNILGFGGIEHMNSSSIMMPSNGQLLERADQKNAFYTFLAHEYFHAYNVKRIRPIELGPFDYSKPNYTRLLWISEGFTDYYANLIMLRAGLSNSQKVLQNYSEQIRNYENGTGKFYQSASQASLGIWEQDGQPTERSPEQVAKTISVYDKGCALAMLFDLKIRHETRNRQSLDDVMRYLYHHYYQLKKRGFTEKEFKITCEKIAGAHLDELFAYAKSTIPINYSKYLAYAGLNIDTVTRTSAELTTGAILGTDKRDSSLKVRSVVWNSPAFNSGLRSGDQILKVNDRQIDQQQYEDLAKHRYAGETIVYEIRREGQRLFATATWHKKSERSFVITKMKKADPLQRRIYDLWLLQKK